MRKYIDIINETPTDEPTSEAKTIWDALSPLQKYALNERLPYAVGWDARERQAVEFISKNMDEFRGKIARKAQHDLDNLDDGGIHRLY